jgi:hypothetical protein
MKLRKRYLTDEELMDRWQTDRSGLAEAAANGLKSERRSMANPNCFRSGPHRSGLSYADIVWNEYSLEEVERFEAEHPELFDRDDWLTPQQRMGRMGGKSRHKVEPLRTVQLTKFMRDWRARNPQGTLSQAMKDAAREFSDLPKTFVRDIASALDTRPTKAGRPSRDDNLPPSA